MADLLRAIFARTSTKIALVVIGLVIVGVFLANGLSLGASADACADRLLAAVERHDEAEIRALVKNPSMRDQLLAGATVELAFVRPVSPEWSRVGLMVKTSTSRALVPLQLEAKGGDCQFLRDY